MRNYDPTNKQKNILWTTDAKVELPIYLQKSGVGSEKPKTLFEVWDHTIEKFGKLNALAVKNQTTGKWVYSTYSEFYNMVKLLASAFISRGVNERCGISVLGYNHPVWVIAYHAAIFANCVNCGIYITNEPDACKYVLENSDSEVILVENNMQMDKILQVWHTLPKLKYLIHWGNDFSREKVKTLGIS